jgi:hypothetical protein
MVITLVHLQPFNRAHERDGGGESSFVRHSCQAAHAPRSKLLICVSHSLLSCLEGLTRAVNDIGKQSWVPQFNVIERADDNYFSGNARVVTNVDRQYKASLFVKFDLARE